MGKYNLKISFMGYKPITVRNLQRDRTEKGGP